MRSKGLNREAALQLLSEQLNDAILTTLFPRHSTADLRKLIAGEISLIAPPSGKPCPSEAAPPPGAFQSGTECKLFTDGASRGNPGEAGAGAVLLNQHDQELLTCSRYLGTCTNNAAEYRALLIGLERALQYGCTELAIFLDSELIVRQIEGRYKVKNQNLKPLFQQVQAALSRLNNWSVAHVPRSQNSRADALANRGIDEKHLQE